MQLPLKATPRFAFNVISAAVIALPPTQSPQQCFFPFFFVKIKKKQDKSKEEGKSERVTFIDEIKNFEDEAIQKLFTCYLFYLQPS